MKRLLESQGELEPGEQLLATLLRAAPPARSDPFRKRRIRAQLENRGPTPRFGLRPAIVCGTVLLATAATAAVTQIPVRATWQQWFAAPAPAASTTVLADAARTRRQVIDTEAAPPAVAASAPPSTSTPALTPSPSAVRPQASRLAAPSSEDPTLVVSAIRALRNQRDPAKARVLLNQYLKENPRGALAEDALALSIEAAANMKDKQAAALARRYLAAYPNGRHRQLALTVSEQ